MSTGQDDEQTDAERVLSQALRAMAGGAKPAPPETARALAPAARTPRFTATQVILLAAAIGLLIGVAAGLLSLLL